MKDEDDNKTTNLVGLELGLALLYNLWLRVERVWLLVEYVWEKWVWRFLYSYAWWIWALVLLELMMMYWLDTVNYYS